MFGEVRRITKIKEDHSIVKSIKMLCMYQDTSIPKLEKELGFGHGLIYTWDKASPSAEKLVKVALRFNVSTDYLLGLTNE